ncbi:MAG: CDP-diacylglycerol--serine O-phosphatidyltransferase [Nitrosomonas sp.]|nr:CDP-diacylglycerol--serine O-phosphatidyltransferase [Nitrosomonas sp.]
MVTLHRQQLLDKIPRTTISTSDITLLLNTKDYLEQLLALIDTAMVRIYLTVLYLENDDAGRLLMDHLISAKQRNPQLEIKIFVDFHRARRSIIGQNAAKNNATFYREIDVQYPDFIEIYGVAVKQKELFGVLHLKGLVIDDTLLYTGASINNVYLHYQERYRYDRYCVINCKPLCDSFVEYLDRVLIPSDCVYRFNRKPLSLDNHFRKKVSAQYRRLTRTKYQLEKNQNGRLTITPLIGLGKHNNQLNKVIQHQIQQTQQYMVIYTPYFNLPGLLKRDIAHLLRRGTQIEIIVGDKRANDFFIPEDQTFTKIGMVPYLYETNLRKFIKRHQNAVDKDLLSIRLWRHDTHSFHLKGVSSDDRYHLLTGHNLNPRAWRLDFENGLLIDDQDSQLIKLFKQEHQQIIKHTNVIENWQQLETQRDYPTIVQKWLTRLNWTNLDKLLKQYM